MDKRKVEAIVQEAKRMQPYFNILIASDSQRRNARTAPFLIVSL